MIIHNLFLGTYPASATVRVVRADLGATYGKEWQTRNVTRWIDNDYRYHREDRTPCLAIDAKLWDLLDSGLGFLEGAFHCRDCGAVERNRWLEHVRAHLLSVRLCHDCNYWQERLDGLAGGRVAIIDARAYFIDEDKPAGYQGFLGFGGSRHDIAFKDGRTVTTKNLWFNGDVPEHWRARLPDNARFVKRDKQPQPGHDRFTGDGP
jgi:hypothetical protein